MSDYWKKIRVQVEPRQKEFLIGVQQDTKVGDVLNSIAEACEAEGISLSQWAKNKVGTTNANLVFMRKSTELALLPPDLSFGELFPELEDDETFVIDAQGQVGA